MCSELPDVFINKKWLINDYNRVINDALTGLVKCNPDLALLDVGHVVVRRDHLSMDKVKVLAGGASGHEPFFAGFVGSGMLTAAVQGSVYTSPTTNVVLRTIKELARRHEQGILVIVCDNISDRLNFGLAVERAKNIPNVKIRMLCVADDVTTGPTRQGLVGVMLFCKIAGAMAEANHFLFDIKLFCNDLIGNVATVSVISKPAVNPNFEVSSCARLVTAELEFGPTLYGQIGFFKSKMTTCHDVVKSLLAQLTNPEMKGSIVLNKLIPVVVVVSNLGGANKIEELIFVNEVISQLHEQGITVERMYYGTYATSIDMIGFSLTVLNVIHNDIVVYLDAPCSAPFWKSYSNYVINPTTVITLSSKVPQAEMQVKPDRGPVVNDSMAKGIEQVLSFACGALISCEKQLNIMDSESGDADTGSNIKAPCSKILEYVTRKKLKINWPFMLLQELSYILETFSEGLLTCFYAIMFEAAAGVFLPMNESDFITVEHLQKCLEAAHKAIERYGRTSRGKLTMYDTLVSAEEALKKASKLQLSIQDAIGLMATNAEESSRRTRANDATYPDPGSHIVAIWMRAAYEALKLQENVSDDRNWDVRSNI